MTPEQRARNDTFKLLPTQGDRESFLSVMRGEIGSGDDQITRAYRFFERKIRPSEIPDLEKFKEIVVSQLVLVSIVLERDDNPHLVFESLNAKGRALTQADLIRNYFFMRIHVKDQERLYGIYWTPMQETTENTYRPRIFIIFDILRRIPMSFVLRLLQRIQGARQGFLSSTG